MKQILAFMLATGLVLGVQQANAASHTHTTHKTAKKSHAKTADKDKDKADDAKDDDSMTPDTAGSVSTELQCELGDKVTIYRNETDDKHIALRWKNQVRRLTRVDTTTGANRFENHKYGLVWINIPAKGMLLDSKKGHQLANDCKAAG